MVTSKSSSSFICRSNQAIASGESCPPTETGAKMAHPQLAQPLRRVGEAVVFEMEH